MNILEFLRDANLIGNSYNVIGIAWFVFSFSIMTYHYFRVHRGDIIKGILFGLSSTMLVHLLSDEINFFLFACSRTSVRTAFSLYSQILDKYYRWLVLIPTVVYMMSRAYDFKYYWDKRGLCIILMGTTLYGVLSVSLGWYGWGYTDPLNVQVYVCTYLLYYVAFAALVYRYYPKEMLMND